MDMVCIYCGADTQVSNSRLQKRINQVWRRRLCIQCGNMFTTHERVDLETGIIVQYSAKDLRPFIRDILFISIYECCKHRPRAATEASALTQTAIAHLVAKSKQGSISRNDVACTVAEVLERFDAVAGTMYRAYHPSPDPKR